MKKNLIFMIIGMIIMGSIVFAADLLADAKSISYESEYTERDNVADVLTELLSSNYAIDSYDLIVQEKYNITALSTHNNTSSWSAEFELPANRKFFYVLFNCDKYEGMMSTYNKVTFSSNVISSKLLFDGSTSYASGGLTSANLLYGIEIEKTNEPTKITLYRTHCQFNSHAPIYTVSIF